MYKSANFINILADNISNNYYLQLFMACLIGIATFIEFYMYTHNKHPYWFDIVIHYAILVLGITMTGRLFSGVLLRHNSFSNPITLSENFIIISSMIFGIVLAKLIVFIMQKQKHNNIKIQ